MPDALRREHASYEEDCEWALVALAFPEEFKAYYATLPSGNEGLSLQRKDKPWYQGDIIESAKATVRDFYPEDYEARFGVTLQPGESIRRDEATFHQAHKDDFIAVAAFGSWHERVPEGMVGVLAKKGGRMGGGAQERFYLVPKEEYEKRGRLSFVIDENRHECVEEA
jgi:hypothetical protein